MSQINYKKPSLAAGQPFDYITKCVFASMVPCLIILYGLTPTG